MTNKKNSKHSQKRLKLKHNRKNSRKESTRVDKKYVEKDFIVEKNIRKDKHNRSCSSSRSESLKVKEFIKVKKIECERERSCKSENSNNSRHRRGRKEQKGTDNWSDCSLSSSSSDSDSSSNSECEPINERTRKYIRQTYFRILAKPCDIKVLREAEHHYVRQDEDLSNAHVTTVTINFNNTPMILNSYVATAPFANYAFQSSELAGNTTNDCCKKYLNLFEVKITEIPNYKNGKLFSGLKSRVQEYVNELKRFGLDVAGVNYSWNGQHAFMATINHQNIGMNPVRFAKRTALALRSVGMLIQPGCN